MPEAGQHIVTSFEQELRRLRDLVSEMGGLVENELALAVEAVVRRDPARPPRRWSRSRASMRWSARWSSSWSACWRCASRWRSICARSSRR